MECIIDHHETKECSDDLFKLPRFPSPVAFIRQGMKYEAKHFWWSMHVDASEMFSLRVRYIYIYIRILFFSPPLHWGRG